MRLIDADALEQFFLHENKRLMELLEDVDEEEKEYIKTILPTVEWARKTVHNVKTIEAEPVKRGKWMQDKVAEIQYRYNCSECGNPIYDKIRPYKYCPNCGARMEK